MHGGAAKSGYHTPASYKLKPNSSPLLGTRRQLRDKVGDKDPGRTHGGRQGGRQRQDGRQSGSQSGRQGGEKFQGSR